MGTSIANESGVSRRSFLTAAVIGAAGIIGASMLPGCSNEKGASAKEDAWDLETDIVVVGSGAAGVAAAVTAIEEGSEVVMVEKADLIGGATSATVQYCAPTSSLAIPQNFDDVTDSAELMFENAMEVSEGTADPALVKIWCDGAADAIDWMIDHGCEFKETLKICEGRQGQGKYIAKTAGELTTKLIPIIQEKATLLNNCPLESLVANEEGRIIGAICLESGKEKRIRARKAVIICSGPWTNDEVMIPRHMNELPETPAAAGETFASLGMPYGPFTGEAIRAAQKAGAAVRHMEYCVPEPCYSTSDLMSQGVAVAGITRVVGQVMVDSNGKRFTDEGKTRGAIARDVLKLEDNVFYPVLDGHFASKAETSFGIPAGTLIASIQAYNEGCSSGTDEFGKDPHFLTPINQAPFYVGPVETCIMLYTHGGLDADENARVRNTDGDVIPGLYAAGMCTGGQFGTDTVSGSWQTNSIVFGRIAGANASKETAE